MTQFQKSQFLQLLHEQTKFVNDNQSLNNFDNKKANKLYQYLGLLQDYTFWENRENYIQLLDNFIQNKIIFDQFIRQFSHLKISDLKSEKRVEKKLRQIVSGNFDVKDIEIKYNSESYGFAALIFNLQDAVDICDPDVSSEENLKYPNRLIYGLSEKFLKLEIENYFLPEMRSY